MPGVEARNGFANAQEIRQAHTHNPPPAQPAYQVIATGAALAIGGRQAMALPLSFLIGAVIATAHAVALAWNVRLYIASSASRAVLLHLARTGALLLALLALALAGPRFLVTGVAGLACAHLALVPAMRRFA